MSYDREKRRLRRKRNQVAKELNLKRTTEFRPKRIDKNKKHIVVELLEKEIVYE